MASPSTGSLGRAVCNAVSTYARHAGPSTSANGRRLMTTSSSAIVRRASRRNEACTANTSALHTRHISSSSSQKSAVEPAVHLPLLAKTDPQLYQAVRPTPRSAYVALAYRLKLIVAETDEAVRQERLALLIRACTHPTFASLIERTSELDGDQAAHAGGSGKGIVRTPDASTEELRDELRALDLQYVNISPKDNNASLATLGNSLMGLIASEYLHLRYPNLPNRVLKAALSAYVGPTTLSDVAAELGVTAQGLVRWDRRSGSKGNAARRTLSREAFADAMRAIVAIIFQEQGLASARSFVHAQLLTRSVPIVPLLKFDNPKRSLSILMKKLGKEHPQSRLIAETGRLTINPIFVVGVWSGAEKMGEGTGSAIRMAEYRAAEDALRRFYMSERPAAYLSLPSTTLDDELDAGAADGLRANFAFNDIWSVGGVDKNGKSGSASAAFRPSPLGKSEVIFGSKG